MLHRILRPHASHVQPSVFITMLLFALFLGGTANGADEKAIAFDLPAQPMSASLNHIARSSGTKLIYADASVQGLEAPPLKGRYTVQQALDKVLNDQGLRYEVVDNTLIAVKPKESTNTTALPKVTVSGEAGYDSTDPYNPDYNRPNASTATRTDTPIMETPVSIQVVPQQVLKDQQAIQLQQVVQNVSGVQFTPTSGNIGGTDFVIRGFAGGGDGLLRNGRRSPANRDLANVEQVEVLKGPASVLFGRLEPGGLVNVVTKKPLDNPYYALQQQFGSYDLFRTTVDATGPIDADGSLLYRFNLGYTDTESFRDELFDRALFIAPALTWRPSEGTEVNLNYEYRQRDNLFDSGIPVRFADGNNRIPPISRRTQFTEPGIHDEQDYHLVDLNWSHRFNAFDVDWTVRNGFQYQRNEFNFREISSGGVRADGRTVDRFIFIGPQNQDYYQVFFNLIGKFDLLGTKHTALVGWDYFDQQNKSKGFFDSAGQFDVSIDLFNPVLGRVDLATILAQPFEDFGKSGNRWHGVYFQDQISLFGDRLHILGGGRYDWAETFSGGSPLSFSDIQTTTIKAKKFSPRVGVVYQPWPWLSLYGNYVESLGTTSNGRTAAGSPLPPQEGEQYEAGFKTAFFDGRLSSTLAFFNVTKSNLSAADRTRPGIAFIAAGEARSRGIELDISGQPTDRLSLIGTYAFTDAQITKATVGRGFPANPGNAGDSLPGAPKHQGSLWAKYEVLPERFEIGSGVFLRSKSPGIIGTTVDAPGFVRWDAFAAYHFKFGASRLTAQVNVNNILDKKYFYSTQFFGGPVLFPAEPLTVLGSLRVEY